MRQATVVLGANYGDEGKGKVVDFLCARLAGEKVVVRHNGGSQAGHTVVAPDGRRHVFSHFGAGSFAGAGTYLAKHFVCNPLLFWREHRQLRDLGVEPVVGIDPRCFVTTPYDMLINQAVEDARADRRHGSVGVGFGETIERNNYPGFQLWKADLADEKKLIEKMRLIRDRWMPLRCEQLKIEPLPKSDPRLSDELLVKAIEATIAFDRATIAAGAEFLDGKAVVFEGAQGLALDMDGKNFPHVTRSNTGLKNVLPLARVLGLELDVVYVSRPYLTKHGAGPLPGEYEPPSTIRDETNGEHPYQGRLRFGHIDFPALRERIFGDLALAAPADLPCSVALTCVDQVAVDEVERFRSEFRVISLQSHGARRDQTTQRH